MSMRISVTDRNIVDGKECESEDAMPHEDETIVTVGIILWPARDPRVRFGGPQGADGRIGGRKDQQTGGDER